MGHPYHHAVSAARKFGGKWTDYIDIENWFDETKKVIPDFRHRALRHHTLGIFWAEEKFGTVIINSDGKAVPVRAIGEQHVLEDLGWIPTPMDWMKNLRPERWMGANVQNLEASDMTPEQRKEYEEETKKRGIPTLVD